MIKIVLNTLIPGDKKLNMPPASEIGFNAYEIKYEIKQITNDFLSELTKISQSQFSKIFIELGEDQKKKALNILKLKNIRLFSVFLKHVFRAYYSDIRVLSLLRVGSSPPFPDGNEIKEDDWSILSPVYERGPIYKIIDED